MSLNEKDSWPFDYGSVRSERPKVPIGSIIDFMAFFIAEAVISASLITSVVVCHRHQVEIDKKR
jgi:hypothetical protein